MECLSSLFSRLCSSLRTRKRQDNSPTIGHNKEPCSGVSEGPEPNQFTLNKTNTYSSFSSDISTKSTSSFSLLTRRSTGLSIASVIQSAKNLSNHRNGMKNPVTHSLSERIHDTLCTDDPILGFIPNGVVDELICEDVVKSVLEELQPRTEIPMLTSFICGPAKRLFALLVFGTKPQLIDYFYEHKFDDENLPLSLKRKSTSAPWEASLLKDVNMMVDARPFNVPELWDRRMISDFQNTWQGPFFSPVFSKHRFAYQFHEKTRMPFIPHEERKMPAVSNFSVVDEKRIHRNHVEIDESICMIDSEGYPHVAVKNPKPWSNSMEALIQFEEVVKVEVANLEMLRDMNHAHLISAIAYYKLGNEHFILFPWASQGSLKAFWKKDPPALDRWFLKWFFTQLCGLSEAIAKLHHQANNSQNGDFQSKNERSLRHGDLKPENILCFENSAEPKAIHRKAHQCILKITDVGLSRPHDRVTEMRVTATRTMAGTILYEPPEVELKKGQPRSRLYDIWSVGCIYFEFLIWVLYGSKGLTRFHQDLSIMGTDTKFYQIDKETTTAQLNKDVQKWIDHIKEDPRCLKNTALRALLELIVEGLLVPHVPNRSTSNTPRLGTHLESLTLTDAAPSSPSLTFRAATFLPEDGRKQSSQTRLDANEVYEHLKRILDDGVSSKIEWMKWNTSTAQDVPGSFGNLLHPLNAPRHLHNPENVGHKDISISIGQELDDKWEYTPDTQAAGRLFSDPSFRAGLARTSEDSKLCDRCGSLRLWLQTCDFSDTITDLREKSSSCDLCCLLLQYVDDVGPRSSDTVQFFKVGSFLTCSHIPQQPIVSLYTLPSLQLEARPLSLQIGLPKFPEAASTSHVKLLAEWIRSCDESHKCLPGTNAILPTRVIDVGDKHSPNVRLCCDTKRPPGKYLALSHRWGSKKTFCTEKDNIKEHEEGIRIDNLPRTFSDAIQVTRKLGIPYLWIDSLCIIQNDKNDWEEESKRMEDVFSSAYATIAASCASGTDGDGFLKARIPRQCVTITNNASGLKFYACNAVDDFYNDVDNGELNNRGWVLQERALSRRTIYFTEKQTYWECGEGVRCETLTRMKNAKAAFLGDANFPRSVDDFVKGKKIKLWQGLYERYSNLALSYKADRPVAIRGLEKRLIRTLATVGGYGVFDSFLHRSLLWQRSSDTLTRIPFPEDRHPPIPSWSWMRYDGGIKYMDVPFGKVTWNENISSPFKAGNLDSGHGVQGRLPFEIKAPVCEMHEDAYRRLILDEPGRTFTNPLKCVIIGSNQNSELDEHRLHYVLVVKIVFGKTFGSYERVGIGMLNNNQIQAELSELAFIR